MVAPVAWSTDARDGGSQGPAAVDWSEFGVPLCELDLLSQLARDARAGRLRIPLDELERAAVAPAALATPPWPPGLARILRERHQALRQQLATAVASLTPEMQRGARGVLVWSALAWQASLRAERALPHAAAPSLASAAAANWRAWRAARAAATGTLRLG
jgi:phytoene/squalene synthetase